jgi:arsenate reductase-like glutaredoxin family protein
MKNDGSKFEKRWMVRSDICPHCQRASNRKFLDENKARIFQRVMDKGMNKAELYQWVQKFNSKAWDWVKMDVW